MSPVLNPSFVTDLSSWTTHESDQVGAYASLAERNTTIFPTCCRLRAQAGTTAPSQITRHIGQVIDLTGVASIGYRWKAISNRPGTGQAQIAFGLLIEGQTPAYQVCSQVYAEYIKTEEGVALWQNSGGLTGNQTVTFTTYAASSSGLVVSIDAYFTDVTLNDSITPAQKAHLGPLCQRSKRRTCFV